MSEEPEYVGCTFCQNKFVGEIVPIVLDCGHKVCSYCLPELESDGRLCYVDRCRAIKLVKDGETVAGAVARKRQKLEILDMQLSAGRLRETIALDKVRSENESKVRDTKHSFELGSKNNLVRILFHTPSPHREQSTLDTVYTIFEPQRNSPFDHTHQGLYLLTDRSHMGFFYSNAGVELNGFVGGTTSDVMYQVLEQKYNLPVEMLKICLESDGEVAINLKYAYKLADDFVFRLTLSDLSLESKLKDFCDWKIPAISKVRSDAGDVATFNGLIPITSKNRTSSKGWVLENYVPDTRTRDRKIEALARSLARKEDVIIDEMSRLEKRITQKIKQIECDIDILISDYELPSDIPSSVVCKPLEISFKYDHTVRKTFADIEASFSAQYSPYWPGCTKLRKDTVVAPLNQYFAVVMGDGRTTLVDLKSDLLHKMKRIKPGRRAFVLCYRRAKLVVASGDTVWVNYAGKEDVEKQKAYQMSTFERVDKPMPRVVFGELPEQITPREPVIVADIEAIRTRLWSMATRNGCIRIYGSITY